MAQLVQVSNREQPGEERFEFRLADQERALILKEVRDPEHVLEWVRHPAGEGGLYRLRAEEATELYESIESFAYMSSKGEATQQAMQKLVAELEEMVEGYYRKHYAGRVVRLPIGPEGPPPEKEALGASRNQPCPCGSGKKYKKCCGRS
jgi:hypothetical protein